MELRIENSQFAPNQGGNGGGSTFYQGRPQQDDQEDDREEAKAPVARRLQGDICVLPSGRKSLLTLSVSTNAPTQEPADLGGLGDEIQRSLRMMTLMVTRMERDFERRLRFEVGDLVIGA